MDGVTTTPCPWGALTQLVRGCEPPPFGIVEGVKTQPSASPEPRLQLSPLRRGGFVAHPTAEPSWVPAPRGTEHPLSSPPRVCWSWLRVGNAEEGLRGVTKAAELCQQQGEGRCARGEQAKRGSVHKYFGTGRQSQENVPTGHAALLCAALPLPPKGS